MPSLIDLLNRTYKHNYRIPKTRSFVYISGMNQRIFYLLLTLCLLVSGCGGASGNLDSSEQSNKSPGKRVMAWIEACESDYRYCDEKIMEMIEKQDGPGLYARINPYIDPENSRECLEDSEGDSCIANRFIASSQVSDLSCEEVKAFGYGFFCWGEFIVRNTGSVPIDDFISASLYDSEGNEFAADVDGGFEVNFYKMDFDQNFNVELNPEKSQILHFGFSVPDIDREYVSIMLKGYDYSHYLPLCKKNSGDQKKFGESDRIAIYESARLLNSCKWDLQNGGYVNRLDGTPSG